MKPQPHLAGKQMLFYIPSYLPNLFLFLSGRIWATGFYTSLIHYVFIFFYSRPLTILCSILFLFYSLTFSSNLISIIFFLLSSLLYKSLLLYSLSFSFLFYILFLLWFLLRLFYPKSVMRYSIFLKCKRYFPLYWHVNNIFTCCLFLYFCPCFRSLAISFIDCT